jgi:cohesin loading factor subunit SCC2
VTSDALCGDKRLAWLFETMAAPRFKLDLVTYGDPVALLPLPSAVRPTQASLLPPGSTALDAQLARDPQVVQQLQEALTSTDISYV